VRSWTFPSRDRSPAPRLSSDYLTVPMNDHRNPQYQSVNSPRTHSPGGSLLPTAQIPWISISPDYSVGSPLLFYGIFWHRCFSCGRLAMRFSASGISTVSGLVAVSVDIWVGRRSSCDVRSDADRSSATLSDLGFDDIHHRLRGLRSNHHDRGYSGTGSLQKHGYDKPPILNTAFRSKLSVPIKRQKPLQRRPSEQHQRESAQRQKTPPFVDLPQFPNHFAVDEIGETVRRAEGLKGTN
jgi:hypothetical protein